MINDDESLRMPTKVSYGPNNLHSRIIKYGESSKLQNNRESEEDFMTDESSEPTGDSGESQKEQKTRQFQWTANCNLSNMRNMRNMRNQILNQ